MESKKVSPDRNEGRRCLYLWEAQRRAALRVLAVPALEDLPADVLWVNLDVIFSGDRREK